MSSMNRLFCIRGAICTENSKDEIIQNVARIFKEMVLKNGITAEKDFVSIQFTVTPDIDEMNPASALRHGDIGMDVSHIPLFCAQEPVMKNSLKKVIRVMLSVYLPENSSVTSVYLNGAEVLRPDIARN